MKARLPKGYGGGPQNMNAMIRQAQKMQEEMEALQEEPGSQGPEQREEEEGGPLGGLPEAEEPVCPEEEAQHLGRCLVQEEMEALQEELDVREYTIESGGGAVKLVINGKKEITSLEIDKELVDPDDIESLTDVLIAAFNSAVKKVEETNAAEQEKITGKLNVPGLV